MGQNKMVSQGKVTEERKGDQDGETATETETGKGEEEGRANGVRASAEPRGSRPVAELMALGPPCVCWGRFPEK